MPILVLTHWTQKFNTPGEQAFLGITMMLVGISLVLLILVLTSILVSMMSKIIGNKRKNKFDQQGPDFEAVEKVETQAKGSLPAAVDSSASGQDPALIAVIAAAVHSMLSKDAGSESTKSIAGFRIRRIRRV